MVWRTLWIVNRLVNSPETNSRKTLAQKTTWMNFKVCWLWTGDCISLKVILVGSSLHQCKHHGLFFGVNSEEGIWCLVGLDNKLVKSLTSSTPNPDMNTLHPEKLIKCLIQHFIVILNVENIKLNNSIITRPVTSLILYTWKIPQFALLVDLSPFLTANPNNPCCIIWRAAVH